MIHRICTAAAACLILMIPSTTTATLQRDPLDAASLRCAQEDLDSLWEAYDLKETNEDAARERMHALLRAWAEREQYRERQDDSAARIANDVYAILFRARYFGDPRLLNQGVFTARLRLYVLIPDSVDYAVVEDAALWDTVSGIAGTARARNGIAQERLQYRKFKPRLDMPVPVIHVDNARYEALNSFINGHRIAQAYSRERTPPHERFEWLNEFFHVCFSHGTERFPIYTRPSIHRILLNAAMTESVVPMTWVCWSGYTKFCRKLDDYWQVVRVFDNWMV